MLRFGSIEFMAIGNGYDMELLPPRANPDAPATQPRRRRCSGKRVRQARMERRRAARLSSPTWVEAGVPQPDAVVENATPSSPKPATMPTNGNASRPPLLPYWMRIAAVTFASSVSTNMSAYEDLPGHHLL